MNSTEYGSCSDKENELSCVCSKEHEDNFAFCESESPRKEGECAWTSDG